MCKIIYIDNIILYFIVFTGFGKKNIYVYISAPDINFKC